MKQSRLNVSETDISNLPKRSYVDRMNYKAQLEYLVSKELSTSELDPPSLNFFNIHKVGQRYFGVTQILE